MPERRDDDLGTNAAERRLTEMADRYIPQALDSLDQTLGTAKKFTTEPAVKVVTYVVYGVALATAAITALVALILIIVRLIDVYGPGPLWLGYLILAGCFGLAGVLCLRRGK